ncbi:MAG: hypothetical protein R3F31_11635 [Verrucomicrobiales bacterium]
MTWTASLYDYLYRSMPLHTAGLLTAVFLIILHGILLPGGIAATISRWLPPELPGRGLAVPRVSLGLSDLE